MPSRHQSTSSIGLGEACVRGNNSNFVCNSEKRPCVPTKSRGQQRQGIRHSSMLTRLFGFLCMRFLCRVGEASNPGPDGHFVLGTANTTGALGKCGMMKEMPRGTWGLTETHLTAEGQRRFAVELKATMPEARFHGGYPAPPLSTSLGGKSTGVGVLSNKPMRGLSGDWSEAIWKSSRIQACAILEQTQWIKLAVIYGYASDPKNVATRESTSAILDPAIQRLVHNCTGYRAICGDLNQPTDALDGFAHLRQWGWVEVQEYAHHKWGRQIQPICHGKSTLDHLWISPELAEKLLEVHTEASLFPDHAIL